MIGLTNEGRKKVRNLIKELEAKRKELLDAGKDTAKSTIIPDEDYIVQCIDEEACDGCYAEFWACSDNDRDMQELVLEEGKDYIVEGDE